jgi:hypothetical protein
MNHLAARPLLERRDLRLCRLREAIATRCGVPPSALASLDPSTVAAIAARLHEERVLRVGFRIEQAPQRRDGMSDGTPVAADPSRSRTTVGA